MSRVEMAHPDLQINMPNRQVCFVDKHPVPQGVTMFSAQGLEKEQAILGIPQAQDGREILFFS